MNDKKKFFLNTDKNFNWKTTIKKLIRVKQGNNFWIYNFISFMNSNYFSTENLVDSTCPSLSWLGMKVIINCVKTIYLCVTFN